MALLWSSHVSIRPFAQLEQRRADRFPTFGELVDDAEGRPTNHVAIDQSGFPQFGKAFGEHTLADPRNGSGQDREACRALQQEAEDDARPTLAEEGEDLGEPLIAFERPLRQAPGHGASVAGRDSFR